MDNKQFKEIEPTIKKLAGEIAKGDEFLYEELCQEGAIAALKAYDRYVVVEGADIKTYLYHSIRGGMLDALRPKRKTSVFGEERDHLNTDTVVGKDESNDPVNITDKASYDAWVDSERDQAKSEAINEYIDRCGLTDKEEFCLRMHCIEDVKQSDIAKELGVKQNTVSEAITRAKNKLKNNSNILKSLNLIKKDK